MPRGNQIKWKRKHSTGHGLAYRQYTTEMLSSQ